MVGLALAGCLVALLVLRTGDWPYVALGNADPGWIVRIGAPVTRLLSEAAATVCIGSLVFAACCVAPQDSGYLAAGGYAALRSAARWAVLWSLATLVWVPMSAADAAGKDLAATLAPKTLVGLIDAMEEPKSVLVTLCAALVVAIGARVTLRWQPTVALLVLALFGLLPPLATGNAASDAGHDLATAAIMIHVPAAVIWVGLLIAVLRPDWRRRTSQGSLSIRYQRIALACWLVLGVTGVVDAMVMVPLNDLLRTEYGVLVLVKLVAFGVLGVFGVRFRRRALRRVRDEDGAGGAFGLAAGELLILGCTFAVSVGLTHLPPPSFVGKPVTALQTLLGYDLLGSPIFLRLVTEWRFDVLFGSLAIVLAVGYLAGILRLRRCGKEWSFGKAGAWLAGCTLLLLATSSGVGRYASAMFSVHLGAHMTIGMLVPLLLAMGGPLGLAREALRPATADELPGPRAWLADLAGSKVVRLLAHPIVALGAFVGSPFVLYFTPLFDAAVRFHWAHLAIYAYFLLVGYLFAWTVVGTDPTPRPLPNLVRLGMLLAAMPFDIVFGAMVMNTHSVIGSGPAASNMYHALALPWVPDLLADQRAAGVTALVLSEMALLIALGAVLLRWAKIDDSDDGSGLGNYRTLLAELTPHTRGTRSAAADEATEPQAVRHNE